MLLTPIPIVVDSNFVDVLTKSEPMKRHSKPLDSLCCLDLHSVDKASFGKLDIRVVDEYISCTNLAEHSSPRKKHRLGDDDDHVPKNRSMISTFWY